jgi:hypothetical protein
LCASAATETIGLLEDRYSTSLSTLEAYQRLCPDRSQHRLPLDPADHVFPTTNSVVIHSAATRSRILEAAKCRRVGVPCMFIALADRMARDQVEGFSSYKVE